jgi:hypothetical protein
VLQDLRPSPLPGYEVRFERPPGDQAQVDFAQFQVIFTDEPTVTRIVWLFSFVLGFSRLDLGPLRTSSGHAGGSALSHGGRQLQQRLRPQYLLPCDGIRAVELSD